MASLHNQTDGQTKDQHLVRLRDLLNLPFNTLTDEALTFALSGQYPVVARYVADKHLSLACEIGPVASLSAEDWRSLATRLSDSHDYDFPSGLIVISGRIGLLWQCRADIAIDAWLTLAQNALTLAMELQEKFRSKSPR